MSNEDILNQFNSLPPEGQRQVIDLLDTLHQRYGPPSRGDEKASVGLAEEGFVGMWEDREDILDSTVWVRQNREREWVKHGG